MGLAGELVNKVNCNLHFKDKLKSHKAWLAGTGGGACVEEHVSDRPSVAIREKTPDRQDLQGA